MGKGIVILSMLVLLSSFVLANSATQQVTVTVVPGFLDVYSPTQDRVYQENSILVRFNVTTPLDVNSVWMIEGNENKYLCSKCKTYNKETYFSDGRHNIKIQVRFASGDVIEKGVSFSVDSSSNIYVLSGNTLKKATAKDIMDYLFHYNFTLIWKNEMAPDDLCSIRAKNGNATLNGIDFGNKNSLNFYSSLSLESGEGEITAQNNRKYYGYRFKVTSVVENSNNTLKLEIFDKKSGDSGILEFDKNSGKASGSINNLSIEMMNAFSVTGCGERKGNFYYLEKGKRISRSIEEVRQILSDNPIFISRFSNLKFLFGSNWKLKQVLGLY